MNRQWKPPLAQLHLCLLDPAPMALSADKHQQLVEVLIELLLNAARGATAEEGGSHES